MVINEILHFGRSALPIFNPKFKETTLRSEPKSVNKIVYVKLIKSLVKLANKLKKVTNLLMILLNLFKRFY